MFQNILEDVIEMEEEASTNNDKLQCVFCKKYFENQPEKIYIWHYGRPFHKSSELPGDLTTSSCGQIS